MDASKGALQEHILAGTAQDHHAINARMKIASVFIVSPLIWFA
jgi:hypothetical protein